MDLKVTRLIDGPIIDVNQDERLGGNVNGPSLIKTPTWLPNRKARYYLYFSHHCGDGIRLAVADDLLGPWRICSNGVLHLSETPLPTQKPDVAEPQWAIDRGISGLYPHIASPDVHVDHSTNQLKMYFHGLDHDGEQRTLCATSADGLIWAVIPKRINQTYLRVFEYGGARYALALGGQVMREDPQGYFELGHWLFSKTHRHSAVIVREDKLHVIWSRVGDAPEQLLYSVIDLTKPWSEWIASQPKTILKPEQCWEGAGNPIKPSDIGMAKRGECALRDPCICKTDDGVFMIYTGSGESALGVAELLWI